MGDCLERREIILFYSDAWLPTLNRDNRISRNVTLINTFFNSVDNTLSNDPSLLLTGHCFLKHWVDAQTREWFQPAVEATFSATLTNPQTILKTLSERFLEDWRSTWTAPLPGDPHHHFTPLREPPGLTLPDFIHRVLTADSCLYQSAAFQPITRHTFNATYSSWF